MTPGDKPILSGGGHRIFVCRKHDPFTIDDLPPLGLDDDIVYPILVRKRKVIFTTHHSKMKKPDRRSNKKNEDY